MKKANAGINILIMLIVGMMIATAGVTLLYEKYSGYLGESKISGKAIITDVKSGVTVENVATEGAGEANTLILTVEPSEGSETIDMEDMVIVIEQKNTTAVLK
jgi:archaellin